MTEQEFFETMKNRGAQFAVAPAPGQVNLVNINLQKIQAAMIPADLANFYQKCGGINLGSGYVFGPNEFARGVKYPVPGILKINQDLTNIPELRGKTIFGRNDLFWFAFDVFGKYMMLDNIGLGTLRVYDDVYRAMFECLVGGKI